MHAEMWAERLRDEPRFRAAVEELLPYALGMLEPASRPALLAAHGARRGASRSSAARTTRAGRSSGRR